jgi:hypothetical protein
MKQLLRALRGRLRRRPRPADTPTIRLRLPGPNRPPTPRGDPPLPVLPPEFTSPTASPYGQDEVKARQQLHKRRLHPGGIPR